MVLELQQCSIMSVELAYRPHSPYVLLDSTFRAALLTPLVRVFGAVHALLELTVLIVPGPLPESVRIVHRVGSVSICLIAAVRPPGHAHHAFLARPAST
jgi:hypothetical protein